MSFLNRIIVGRLCTATVATTRSTAVSNDKALDHFFFTDRDEVGSESAKPRRDRIPDPDCSFMRYFVTRDTTSAKSTSDFIRYRPTDEASMEFWKLCSSEEAKRYPGFLLLTPPDPYSDPPFDSKLPFMNVYHRRYSVDSLLRERNIDDDDDFLDAYYDDGHEEDDDPDWSPEKKVLLLFNDLLVDRFKDKEYHRAEKDFSNPCAWAKSLGFPDSLSYQIMIKGLCIQGLVDRALSLLDEMHRKDMHAAHDIYYAIVAAFHTQGRPSNAEQVWKRMEEHEQVIHGGFSLYPRIEDLVSQGLLSEAVKLVDEMDPYGFDEAMPMPRPGCAYGEEAKRMHRHLLICGCDPQEVDNLMTNSANSGYETALHHSLLQKKRYLLDKHSKMDEAQKLALKLSWTRN